MSIETTQAPSHGRAEAEAADRFILVVEDSPTQAQHLRSILAAAGYEVAVAGNGAEALHLIALRRPAMVICDVVMPVMDGYEFCRRVKSDPRFREIPVLLLTALSDPQAIFKGLASGADFYSLKPYDCFVLRERVRVILDPSTPNPAKNANSSLKVTYAGQTYTLNAGRSQILDLLLATFENVVHKNQELVAANKALAEALNLNKTLRGLIPICSYCKQVRDDQGYWAEVESYISEHSDATFNHSVCPACYAKVMAELHSMAKPGAPGIEG